MQPSRSPLLNKWQVKTDPRVLGPLWGRNGKQNVDDVDVANGVDADDNGGDDDDDGSDDDNDDDDDDGDGDDDL